MIHDEFRAARLAAGLTVTEVARRAGIQRKQVQQLERGANVTLETVRQIASVIPNLERVTLGGLEIVTANADLEEARRAALDLFDVAKRLLAALGAAPATPAAQASRDPVGATRHDPGSDSARRTAERLERRIPEMKRGRKDHS